MKNPNYTAWRLFATAFLIANLFLLQQAALAGQSGCQGGEPVNDVTCNRTSDPNLLKKCCDKDPKNSYFYCPQSRQQEDFAAAMMKYERRQTPGAPRGGDSETRLNRSFFWALLVTLGGIWALIVLSLRRFGWKPRRGRLSAIYRFAFQPARALTTFGLLFVGAIVAGVLTVPEKTAADEKLDRPDKSKMTGAMNPSSKPVFKTAQVVGGTGITQIGAPVFDAAGNRYVRGGFTDSLTVGATTLNAARDYDAFVAKYDAAGNALWARQGSGLTTGAVFVPIEAATALGVDASGNVYVGGVFVKTLTLQGGANPNITLNDNGAAGFNYEPFVAKYSPDGNLLWARGGNSGSPKNANNLETGQNTINQIVFDSNGNPYVTGFASGTRFLGSTIANNGQSDIVLAKLDAANGAPLWKQIIGGTDDDNGLDLKIDNSNNLYVTGNFGSASITFPNGETFTNPDDPEDTLENSTNTFVAKFDSSGANLWVEVLDNDDSVSVSQIAVSGAGDVYLTGYFLDSATFPTQPAPTTLIETEGGGGEEEASFGGYVAKMNTGGDFVWANGFGGLGDALALDAAGRIYVVGTFFDGGTFGEDTANEEQLASFGGADLFVARYDEGGGFDWAKPIAGSTQEGEQLVSSPSGATENSYKPLGIAYNPARGTMFIAGDFLRVLSLDCITLTSAASTQTYLAELTQDNETTSCRVWNGLDEDDNDFDSVDNWNGGILPAANDSIYVPYTGNDFDPPTFNPATNIPLNNVAIADDRILTLEKPLTVNGRLDLLGGFVDAELHPLLLGTAAQTLSISDGLVLGTVQKQFAAGAGAFTFPVGTASSQGFPEYSPVTLSNIAGAGSFSVTANRGAYPNTATGLPANRAARWWTLTNGGLTGADSTFKYLPGDITSGTESGYRAYRIPTGGGAATLVNSTIDTAAKTVTATNVSQFSDWTLAAPAAPTAARVELAGRVTNAAGRGVSRAVVTLIDASGAASDVFSDPFGYYRFADVAVGQTYIVRVRHKRYQFPNRFLTATENVGDLNFTAQ